MSNYNFSGFQTFVETLEIPNTQTIIRVIRVPILYAIKERVQRLLATNSWRPFGPTNSESSVVICWVSDHGGGSNKFGNDI